MTPVNPSLTAHHHWSHHRHGPLLLLSPSYSRFMHLAAFSYHRALAAATTISPSSPVRTLARPLVPVRTVVVAAAARLWWWEKAARTCKPRLPRREKAGVLAASWPAETGGCLYSKRSINGSHVLTGRKLIHLIMNH